jgi:peptidoglycan L-alanyl-D-glutamate endopeptidase CwlK
MSRDMKDLIADFRSDVEEVLAACRQLGIEMRPYFTLRDPWEQAKYWRQSRSIEEIQTAIRDLEQKGAPFLAHILHSVGPQFGDHVTDALPGTSWHQWGEAVDCFWLLDGEAEWSTRKKVTLADGREMNGYRLYGEEGVKRGMISGGFWSDLVDWPHLQKQSGSVLNHYSWPEIDREMRKRFGVEEEPIAITIPTAELGTLAAPSEDFVQVVGKDFHVKGKAFKFIGFNLRGVVHYGARYEGDGTFISQNTQPQHRAEQIRKAYDMGGRVIRVFLPHRNATPQQAGDRLEDLLRIIKDELHYSDLYLIPTLTDFLGYGHVPFKVQGDENDRFYQQIGSHTILIPEYFQQGFARHYLPFVKYIVERFKDEPQIFAWELVNEAKVDNAPGSLVDFKHRIAREIRAIDPNHLITTGMVSTAHAWMFPGDERRQDLYDRHEGGRRLIDFVTVHYPDESHPTGPNYGDIDLADHLEMPVIVEEAMVIPNLPNEEERRAYDRSHDFRNSLDEWLFHREAKANGYMPWGFDALNIGDGDSNGGIGEPFRDFDNLATVFREYANRLKNG